MWVEFLMCRWLNDACFSCICSSNTVCEVKGIILIILFLFWDWSVALDSCINYGLIRFQFLVEELEENIWVIVKPRRKACFVGGEPVVYFAYLVGMKIHSKSYICYYFQIFTILKSGGGGVAMRWYQRGRRHSVRSLLIEFPRERKLKIWKGWNVMMSFLEEPGPEIGPQGLSEVCVTQFLLVIMW